MDLARVRLSPGPGTSSTLQRDTSAATAARGAHSPATLRGTDRSLSGGSQRSRSVWSRRESWSRLSPVPDWVWGGVRSPGPSPEAEAEAGTNKPSVSGKSRVTQNSQ